MEVQFENLSELMRQARMFLAQNPGFIPLHHVEEVSYYGNVDVYVMARGVDVTTPEGNSILNWEAALYLVCRQLCDMGVGDRPFQPHPYLHDPIIVAEEEEAGAENFEAAAGQGGDQPEHLVPGQGAAAPPPVEAGDGVQIHGPFVGQNPLPPPPPLVPAPVVPQLIQPLHWVFGELPPEPKPEPNQEPEAGPGEYIEPFED
jgi:hypothetical protein